MRSMQKLSQQMVSNPSFAANFTVHLTPHDPFSSFTFTRNSSIAANIHAACWFRGGGNSSRCVRCGGVHDNIVGQVCEGCANQENLWDGACFRCLSM